MICELSVRQLFLLRLTLTYKERHLVENLFLKLKNYRPFATLYEKLASSFLLFKTHAIVLILMTIRHLQ